MTVDVRVAVPESPTRAEEWLPRFAVRAQGRASSPVEAITACHRRGLRLCTERQWTAASSREGMTEREPVVVASPSSPSGFAACADGRCEAGRGATDFLCCEPAVALRSDTKRRLELHTVARGVAKLDAALSDDLGAGLTDAFSDEPLVFERRPSETLPLPALVEASLGPPEQRIWLTDGCRATLDRDGRGWDTQCRTLVVASEAARWVDVRTSWRDPPTRVIAIRML